MNQNGSTQKQPWTVERPAADQAEKGTEEHERDYMCGLGSCYPRFLQRFANPRVFFVVYSLMGILQGAYKSYFVGTLSTIERRFAMSSQTTGIILIADNLSPIVINLLAGYYANRISRPKIMGVGALIVVLSCFLSMMPYMVYGPGLHILGRHLLSPPRQHVPQTTSLSRNGLSYFHTSLTQP